jgi:hypothetical protein
MDGGTGRQTPLSSDCVRENDYRRIRRKANLFSIRSGRPVCCASAFSPSAAASVGLCRAASSADTSGCRAPRPSIRAGRARDATPVQAHTRSAPARCSPSAGASLGLTQPNALGLCQDLPVHDTEAYYVDLWFAARRANVQRCQAGRRVDELSVDDEAMPSAAANAVVARRERWLLTRTMQLPLRVRLRIDPRVTYNPGSRCSRPALPGPSLRFLALDAGGS